MTECHQKYYLFHVFIKHVIKFAEQNRNDTKGVRDSVQSPYYSNPDNNESLIIHSKGFRVEPWQREK